MNLEVARNRSNFRLQFLPTGVMNRHDRNPVRRNSMETVIETAAQPTSVAQLATKTKKPARGRETLKEGEGRAESENSG